MVRRRQVEVCNLGSALARKSGLAETEACEDQDNQRRAEMKPIKHQINAVDCIVIYVVKQKIGRPMKRPLGLV